MAEAEVGIHAGHEHGHAMHGVHGGGEHADSFTKAVAIAVSLLGVILAVVTIGSHRAHNAAVLTRSEANDLWAEYQAKRIRQYMAGVTVQLAPLMGPSQAGPQTQAQAQAVKAHYEAEVARYTDETKDFNRKATDKQDESKNEEKRAGLLDTSEGFFELGLVLSSIFFLSKRKMFPVIGSISAVIGAYFCIMGFMI
jgi:hypothetical protein